jgi:hypothetical protein
LAAGSPACSVSAGDARPQAGTWGDRRKKGNRRTTIEAARIAFQAVMEEGGVGGVASGGGEVAGTAYAVARQEEMWWWDEACEEEKVRVKQEVMVAGRVTARLVGASGGGGAGIDVGGRRETGRAVEHETFFFSTW